MSAYYSGKEWNRTGVEPVRLLVVDDSVVMRTLLDRILQPYADIEIVNKVATAEQAFEYLGKQQVDIILLDHEMPGLKGLEALPRILAMAKGAHVVMLSSLGARGSELAVQALALGASDVIRKPSWEEGLPSFGEALAERFLRMAASRKPPQAPLPPLSQRPFPVDFRLGCIGIGASTGGILTLANLLGTLSGTSARGRAGVPIFITQHLPETFTPYFARQVAGMTDLPVLVGAQDLVVRPDHIYLAPGDASLSFRTSGTDIRIALVSERDPVVQTRPSVNRMFAGMASCYGRQSLGVVLTGIGRDGTQGAGAIVDAGGAIIAQDRESSTVWGMPGSVARAGYASATLPPDQMADYIYRHVGLARC